MSDDITRHVSLGRKYAPDPRDRRFTMTPARMAAIPRHVEPGAHHRKLPWKRGPVLDQGHTSQCTVYAAAAFLECAPQHHAKGLGWDPQRFTDIYQAAQRDDEWPGEGYEGTSERAVMKILSGPPLSLVSEYLWVADEATAKEYLLTRGPLLFGTDWFRDMFHPDPFGYIHPSGDLAGGHEVCLRWYYGPSHRKYPDTYEFINSWGEDYGDRGLFRMKADDFRYLFLQCAGDLCSPQETKRARR